MENQEHKSETAPADCLQRLVRQWCLDRAISVSDKDTETQNLIDTAAHFERYITTGKSSAIVEVGALECAFDEAEIGTPNVSRDKVRKVREFIADYVDGFA